VFGFIHFFYKTFIVIKMFYIFFMAFYILDLVHRVHTFIANSSFSLRNLWINGLLFLQTLMDFLWKSVDAEREGMTIIVNKEERVIIGGATREKIYTFSVKECGDAVQLEKKNEAISSVNLE
jgi:hypothetical protein